MRGFTLLEVVIALVILEIGVLGAVGTLVLAASTLSRAAVLERGTAEVEGLFDSITSNPGPGAGTRRFGGGEALWSVDSVGRVEIRALTHTADTLFSVVSVVAVAP